MLILKDIKSYWKESHFAQYKCSDFYFFFLAKQVMLGAWKTKKISLNYLNK